MKLSLIALFIVLSVFLSTASCKKEVVEVKSISVKESFGGMKGTSKKQAELAGLITGTAAGLLKKKAIKKPTTTYVPVKPAKPKTTIKMLRIVTPVLVRVEEGPKETDKVYYVKKEVKHEKKASKIKLIPSFMKGMFKGKIIGKSIGKFVH